MSLLLIGIVFVGFGFHQNGAMGAVAAVALAAPVLLLVAALVLYLAQPCRHLKATYIDQTLAEFVGVSPQFLKGFAANSLTDPK